jgi:hypothetical protein
MADKSSFDLNSSVHSINSVHSLKSVGSDKNNKDVVCDSNPAQEKMTLGKIKFGSTEDLLALATQSFAGTRTAKIICQFKEWDSSHSADRTFLKTSSTDNLLDSQPKDNLKKYYDRYAAEQGKTARKSVMEEIPKDVEAGDFSDPDDIKKHEPTGFSRILENVFHVEERGEKFRNFRRSYGGLHRTVPLCEVPSPAHYNQPNATLIAATVNCQSYPNLPNISNLSLHLTAGSTIKNEVFCGIIHFFACMVRAK